VAELAHYEAELLVVRGVRAAASLDLADELENVRDSWFSDLDHDS
jgi:hypothetical protein